MAREVNGGERGIRTLGEVSNPTHDFQSCTFDQLGHLSDIRLAEREGFEPPVSAKIQRFSRPPLSTAQAPLHLYLFSLILLKNDLRSWLHSCSKIPDVTLSL